MGTREPQRWQLPIMQFILFVLITILILAVGHFARTMLNNYRLSNEKATWQAKIEQEKEEYQRKKEQLAFVQSEAYQRYLAHEMGLYAPDEKPLVLVLPPEMQEEAAAFDPVFREGTDLDPPNWQKWWDLFFGKR